MDGQVVGLRALHEGEGLHRPTEGLLQTAAKAPASPGEYVTALWGLAASGPNDIWAVGTLDFNNTAGAANYAETVGPVTVATYLNTISSSQAALYVAETTSGKFGVYTMAPRPDNQPGIVIRRHDLVLFRQGAAKPN